MYQADARHPSPSLAKKLEALYGLRGDGKKADLSLRPEYIELLRRLGNPHLSLPPVIHVAGTNGKGSVLAFIRAILEADGKTCHVYTSPHLVKFNERIRLAGQLIEDEPLEEALDHVTAQAKGLPVTFFEVTTALAFYLFARQPADFTLLETGLGGRLDSTNVVPAPLATVITAIGYDHQEFLGDQIEQIASEKAGIFKAGANIVIGPQPYEAAYQKLLDLANQSGNKVLAAGREWQVDAKDTHMVFQTEKTSLDLPMPSLQGAVQTSNAGTALATLHACGLDHLFDGPAASGMRQAQWPGRLQPLAAPLIAAGPDHQDQWDLYVDCAHNEDAMKALVPFLRGKAEDGIATHMIFGGLRSRDPARTLSPVMPFVRSLRLTPIPGQDMSHNVHTYHESDSLKHIPVFETPYAAAADCFRKEKPGLLLICGSVYLAGALLEAGGYRLS